MSISWEDPPLPQVGAILHYDSALPHDEAEIVRGSKYWMLDGSCVLIASGHALSVMHALGKEGLYAVFLPGEGIYPFRQGDVTDEVSGRRTGDYLALIPLGEEIRHIAPLGWKKIPKKRGRYARVAGFGRWRRGEDRWLDGIQRRTRIDLAQWHRHKLDLEWRNTGNHDLSADRNNSGGPLLWGNGPGDFRVIGTSRERESYKDQIIQMASWIGSVRRSWLQKTVGEPRWTARESSFQWKDLRIEAPGRNQSKLPGTYAEFPVPAKARGGIARVTLSATPGLRLQMGLAQEKDPVNLLRDLAESDRSSGRFLVRPLGTGDFRLDGSNLLTVAVAPVRVAPEKAPWVEAQICVRFTP